MRPLFLFCHGFGWDDHFWDHLRPYFHDQCFESGSDIPTIDPGTYVVGIGHSLGFARLLGMDITFNALVGLQGFTHFLGRNASLKAKRLREWQAMRRQLTRDPDQTLRDFYKRCHVSKTTDTLNKDALLQDFDELIIPAALPSHVPTLIVGADDDVIVPPALIKDNFGGGSNVTIRMHPTGGHGLGRHHAAIVHQHIKDFIHAVL